MYRNVSNTKSTNVRICSYEHKNMRTGIDEFYCFTDQYPIVSDEQIGFNANAIEILISAGSIDLCRFFREIKVYSYPGISIHSPCFLL